MAAPRSVVMWVTPGSSASSWSTLAVSSGGDRSCGLTYAGEIYCWGDAFVGDGSFNDDWVHSLVSGGHVFTDVSVGASHSCGIADGKAWCWGENWFGDDHLVDVHISNLRRKLADDPRSPDFVCTVRGVGYRIVDPNPESRTGAADPRRSAQL